ncbi:MAG: ribulose-phosphate 3-epimerase [Kofleriaceae bacterium]|nr:ribulose-phosphate 3-epimerase [Kofleriaceae bacterium]MBP9169060.1 ribulose-phosphate 3-epimerase [Kofleriaceae bacterium]MBP9858763.1 ribulose-phosphate 3-epimerase [Kofleriaceae bacterium]
MRPLRIAPSILSADFARLGDEVRAVDRGGADYIHVDVMDGHFVPNLTIGPLVIEAIRKVTTRPLDVHLMIADADRWVGEYARAGADLIGVHVEACPHLHRTVAAIRELGKQPVVVLNPATPLETIRWVLPDVAMVLLMSVNPGFGGQRFIPAVLDKIAALRRDLDDRGLDVAIEVDGGVKLDNAGAIAAAGADVLVAGSAVFGTPDYAATIAALRAAASAARAR